MSSTASLLQPHIHLLKTQRVSPGRFTNMFSQTFVLLLSLSASLLFSTYYLGCAGYDVVSTLKACNITSFHDHCVRALILDPLSMEASIPGLARIITKWADGDKAERYLPGLLETLIGDNEELMLAIGCRLLYNEVSNKRLVDALEGQGVRSDDPLMDHIGNELHSPKSNRWMEVVADICQDLTSKLVGIKSKLATNMPRIESETPTPSIKNQLVSSRIKVSRLSHKTPTSGKAADSQFQANVVVAQDGSGNYTTVTQAVQSAPTNSTQKYVIYIKAGTYKENVVVDATRVNLVFLGDGIGKTILSSDRSNSTGQSVVDSGALVVLGDQFHASMMTIENTAGPQGGQAVAMMSSSNRATFYKCSFVGYQDTLFVVDKVQFYRECDIYGTIDFIFGGAIVVFQDCNIFLQKPIFGQGNVISAQGKKTQADKSATVFHHCKITAAPGIDLTKVMSYLGRPWQQYATTIVMQSFIDGVIDPAGWTDFPGHGAYEQTVTYWEYANTGPGANTSQRVKWSGFKFIKSQADVQQYTVNSFISGADWLPSLGVPFNPGFYT